MAYFKFRHSPGVCRSDNQVNHGLLHYVRYAIAYLECDVEFALFLTKVYDNIILIYHIIK
jgi:hypothetical protein